MGENFLLFTFRPNALQQLAEILVYKIYNGIEWQRDAIIILNLVVPHCFQIQLVIYIQYTVNILQPHWMWHVRKNELKKIIEYIYVYRKINFLSYS